MNNNTKNILILLFLLLSASLNAQEKKIAVGLKMGANISNYWGDVEGAKAKVGFNTGVIVSYAFTPKYLIFSGLDYTIKGAKSKQNGIRTTLNPMYLQVPLHFGYRMNIAESNTKLILKVGPNFAYGVGGKYTVKQDGQKTTRSVFQKDLMKKFDLGLGLGVGIEFDRVGVFLAYDFSLFNVWNLRNMGESGSVRNRCFNYGVAYKF